MATQAPGTCTGLCCSVLLPLPNCPSLLAPQAQSVPFCFSPRLKAVPALSATQLLSLPMRCIVLSPLVLPKPSCPWLLSPQAHMLPLLFKARLWLPPRAPLIHSSFAGTLTCVNVSTPCQGLAKPRPS